MNYFELNELDYKILDKLDYGYSIDELIDFLSGKTENLPENNVKPKDDDCCDNQNIINDEGMNVCTNCGSVFGYDIENEWIPKIWMYKKSVHSRRRWFYNRVRKYVEPKNVDKLVNDFIKVVRVINKNKLLKGRNISRYNYYIIRLASRIGIKVKENISDMKDSYTRRLFHDRLFGKIYPLLGWDIDCECKYYISCKLKRIDDKTDGKKKVKKPKKTGGKKKTKKEVIEL